MWCSLHLYYTRIDALSLQPPSCVTITEFFYLSGNNDGLTYACHLSQMAAQHTVQIFGKLYFGDIEIVLHVLLARGATLFITGCRWCMTIY